MCKAKSELLKNNTRIVSRVEEYKDTSVETRARKTFEVANTNEKGGQTSTLWTGPSSSATLYAELRAHLSFTLLSVRKADLTDTPGARVTKSTDKMKGHQTK